MQHISQQKNATKSANNRGNALIIVLVLIGLIAALTAVAMRSTNRSSSNMDSETARIQAEKIMRQATGWESAINRLVTVNQCSENDINFDNETTARDYTNAHSPTSKNCHMFSMEGAGLTYSNPNPTALDTNFSSDTDFGQWVFTSGYCVLGLGSDDNDACVDEEVALLAILPHVNTAVCMQINELNGINNPTGNPPTENIDSTAPTFDGDYEAVSDAEIGEGATGVELLKHATGCFTSTSGAWSGSHVFYHTLLVR